MIIRAIWNLVARVIVLGMLIAAANDCNAHDKWANGRPIPAWVKSHCCNQDEAHDLGDASIVHPIKGAEGKVTGFKVDGFKNEVSIEKTYPSQDGQVWAFYNGTHYVWNAQNNRYDSVQLDDTSNMNIWCLFVPCYSRNDLPAESGLDSSCS